MIRAADHKSPREAVEFVLQLLKYNDNNGNPYSDVYWLITLVRSISELEFSQQSMSFLPSLLKCIDRLLQFDSLMPSFDGILTINCLHTLVRVALKMSTTIPIDHVCELIKPFRSIERSSWMIRIEANKALLDLEYYCKGRDAAICLFTKFMAEEPSLRGQTKLAAHLMQLCQINSESENDNAVSCTNLVALLRLLASRKAFNNIFLRHHLFCILQVVAGRAPTLYGFTKVKINQGAAMESNGEQPARSASLKLKITRTQEVHTDTPNHSVDAPSIPEATKEGDAVSNRSEGRMNILKIRVKQPASSSKADGVDQLTGQSRGAPNETELGHSSSVSVDAPPMKGAIELPCTSIQNIEEVSSSCDHESRVTASVVFRNSANKDEAGKEFQYTANSSNALGDGLSPTSSRKHEGMFIQKRSSGDRIMAILKPDDVPLVTDYLEGKRKRKKEKKDKGCKEKHGDKDVGRNRSDDPEYLEHKRLKKERKKVKRLARMQEDESKTSASESQDTRKLYKSSGYSSLGDLNKLEESDVHVSKPAETASNNLQGIKGTKIKIKIRN